MYRKFHLNMGHNFFPVSECALEQIFQRGCGVSFPGGIQEPSGHNILPCALVWPYLSRELGLNDLQRSLPALAILQFCDFLKNYMPKTSQKINRANNRKLFLICLRIEAEDWTHLKIMENPVKILILQTPANWEALQGPNKKACQILLLSGMTFAVAQ